jgi:hypothetical protein
MNSAFCPMCGSASTRPVEPLLTSAANGGAVVPAPATATATATATPTVIQTESDRNQAVGVGLILGLLVVAFFGARAVHLGNHFHLQGFGLGETSVRGVEVSVAQCGLDGDGAPTAVLNVHSTKGGTDDYYLDVGVYQAGTQIADMNDIATVGPGETAQRTLTSSVTVTDGSAVTCKLLQGHPVTG